MNFIHCGAMKPRRSACGIIKARSAHAYTLFMLEIFCETGAMCCPRVTTIDVDHEIETRIFNGDLCAKFTLPFSMDIVDVCRTTMPTMSTMVSSKSGDMCIHMEYNYDVRNDPGNRVIGFRIFIPDSLQGLALAALIRSNIRKVARIVEMHALEWLRDN